MTLDEKYSPNNFETWEPILKKNMLNEKNFFKCSHCQYCMPDLHNHICTSTFYGQNVELIDESIKKDCDFKLSFSTYVHIGESNIEPEFTNYINTLY